ncbi:hypothetical protein MPDQ_000560 [Monascus purpureus]|uniref:Integral membrane protein n=1 Tax=Monascus purpureus TaxID=5098 RepID=A0A507R1T1_MONPU|nr:hypothetical protein MPDQ_000560 [Monascus purpureus]
MGKAGRFVYSHNSTLSDIYMFRLDLQNFTSSSKTTDEFSNLLKGIGADDKNQNLTQVLEEAKDQLNIKDFYSIGLLGYCDGNITGKHSENFDTTFCSKPKADFWFNPIEVWQLSNITGADESELEDLLPSDLHKDMNAYRAASKYVFIAFCIAFAATILELFAGIFAVCSRWGSCVTYILGGIAGLFLISAVIVATVLTSIVTHAIQENVQDYGITATFGTHFQVVAWLAVAFHLLADTFWMFSICCCGGNARPHRVTAEKAPYTYESLGPYDHSRGHGNNYPMQDMRTSAYEPYRHV